MTDTERLDAAATNPTAALATPDATLPAGATVVEYPPLYVAADTTAEKYQDHHLWLVRFNLLLLVTAAIVGVFGPSFGMGKQLSLAISALVLALGFGSQLYNRYVRTDRNWFDGRALAEAVKGATWRYMTGALPYTGPAAIAEARFAQELRRLRDKFDTRRDRMTPLPNDAMDVTPGMRRVRGLPLAARRDRYLRDRVEDQLAYYTNKATRNRRRGSQLFWLGQITQGGAVLAAVWRATQVEVLDVVTLLATITAVVSAWSQSGRHNDLASSYTAAAAELTVSRGRITAARDETTLGEAVAEAEDAMTREQTVWVAKRT